MTGLVLRFIPFFFLTLIMCMVYVPCHLLAQKKRGWGNICKCDGSVNERTWVEVCWCCACKKKKNSCCPKPKCCEKKPKLCCDKKSEADKEDKEDKKPTKPALDDSSTKPLREDKKTD